MCNALVAINAGSLSRDQKTGMDLRCPSRLLGEIHGDRRMAIPAFKRIVGLKPRPFVLCELEAHVEKLLPGRDRAENFALDLL